MLLSALSCFILFAAVLFLLFFGAVWSWFSRRRPERAKWLGALSAMLGCCAGTVLALPAAAQWVPAQHFAFLGLHWQIDALAGFFMLPVLLLGLAAAGHSLGYLQGHGGQRQGTYWFFFNLTLLAMLLVCAAATYIELLLAWELMGVMSFALVAFSFQEQETRHAAWVYLLACHAGAVFLILMFVLAGNPNPGYAGTAVACGLLGFGLKAGFPILHVWLPEAHPAAPAPVSAIMSAAMLNLGIYGILRFLPPVSPGLLGWLLLGLGLSGALLGIVLALAQVNLKRLLAYSSIENMGIAFLGLGLGFLGLSQQNAAMAVCGLGGGLLHLWNHALLKGTLFLLAGAVFKSTGTLIIDKMGGLGKDLPVSKNLFIANAAALSGLPPGNAFLSEIMIYLAAFQGVLSGNHVILAAAIIAAVGLALSGGLAAAAFCKASAAVFLGAARNPRNHEPHPECRLMLGPELFLSLLALASVIFAPWLWENILPGVLQQSPLIGGGSWPLSAEHGSQTLSAVRNFSFAIIALIAVLGFLRHRQLRRKVLDTGCTWDCGYALPTARMQYTGTAFTQPLSDYFRLTLGRHRSTVPVQGYFPQEAAVHITASDPGDRLVWHPLSRFTARIADKTRRIQSGYLHLYILMILIALIAMLIYAVASSLPPAAAPEPALPAAGQLHQNAAPLQP
ncbi:MAG: hypothetical protein GX564_04520 [Oligosphaeraceae bacterium]|nr:hypothetical protein [Oligosphaeraceae bacterium]